MKRHSAFDRRLSGLSSWKTRFTIHALLMLASSVALLLSAASFQQRLEDIRAARTDNGGWIVSQLEIDYLELLNCLDEVVLKVRDSDAATVAPKDFALVEREFDIFYSRVDVFLSAMRRLQISQDMRERLDLLREVRDDLTRRIDAIDTPDEETVQAFRRAVMAVRDPVRDVTVAALQAQSDEEARTADDEARLFMRFFIQSILLFVLLALGSFLVIRLWRELDTKSREASRIAAILSNAFDTTLNGVLVTDGAGRILYCNGMAEQIFGAQSETLQGQDAKALLSLGPRDTPDTTALPQDGARFFSIGADDSLIGQGPAKGHCLRTDGTRVPAEIAVVQDEDISGQTILVGFIRDISERVRAEENWRDALQQAHQAAQAKSMFLATMSHEMRTPLHGLLASLSLIDDGNLSGAHLKLLKTARDCSARALEQVNGVLELTRLGDSRETPQPFSVCEVVTSIVEELRPLARESGNRIELDMQGEVDGLRVIGLPLAFTRTLYNLAGNAVKFTSKGVISIRLRLADPGQDGLRLTVEVADTGPGIAPADQDRIFKTFETAGRGETDAATGTGLGLSIARLAVEQQGGMLHLSSVMGKGSRFYFTIPFQEVGAAPATAASTLDDASGTAATGQVKQVLVVDDNEVNRTLMGQMVRRIGHAPGFASNGKEAVSKADRTRYDVILMDFSMPVMDGPEATALIRAGTGKSAQAVIIGVTALIEAGAGVAGGAQMDEVLIKPVTLPQLQEALAHVRHDPAQVDAHDLGGAGDPGVPQDTAPDRAAPPDPDLDPDPDAATDAEADPEAAFAELCELVGVETARRLVAATLTDTREALTAMADRALTPADKAVVIHKAVGSTGLMGFDTLSATLSEAETLARGGHDPHNSPLPGWVERQLTELQDAYAPILEEAASDA